MRVSQPPNGRGSLKWIQRLVAADPQLLTRVLEGQGTSSRGELTWISPLEADDWAEYRDGAFLDRIQHPGLRPRLKEFWPRRGPQWDGLGRYADGTVVLVEAKANIPELRSKCGASEKSRVRINRALAQTADELGLAATRSWTNGYYQYANRLAHLHFLRAAGVSAALVFVYFIGDSDVGGPASQQEWQTGLKAMYEALGLDSTPAGVMNAFIHVQALT